MYVHLASVLEENSSRWNEMRGEDAEAAAPTRKHFFSFARKEDVDIDRERKKKREVHFDFTRERKNASREVPLWAERCNSDLFLLATKGGI